MGPFEFVKAINSKQDIIRDDLDEKSYLPYMINHSFSYFPDTVLLANEMNINHHVDNKLQNDFFINTIRKNPKRFSKWNKVKHDGDFEAVKEYYGYSNEKTRSALSLLSAEQINIIKQKVDHGGRKGKRAS
jgi:purine-nucleoside phosphorylase